MNVLKYKVVQLAHHELGEEEISQRLGRSTSPMHEPPSGQRRTQIQALLLKMRRTEVLSNKIFIL